MKFVLCDKTARYFDCTTNLMKHKRSQTKEHDELQEKQQEIEKLLADIPTSLRQSSLVETFQKGRDYPGDR